MATTLFLPSSSAAPAISPTPDAGWTATSGLDRFIMSPTKANTAMTNKTIALTNVGSSYTLYRQYLYGPLAPASIPTDVSWTLYVRGTENTASMNTFPRTALWVATPAGASRGTIFTTSSAPGGTEYSTTLQSRQNHPTTPTNTAFSIQGGDYLVLEVGTYQQSSTVSGNVSLNFGDDSATNLAASGVTTADNPVLVLDVDLRLFSSGARAYILG